MAELTSQERLQPSLLDRLTDDEPGSLREPVEARVLNKNQLRAAVPRDLSWLFNASRAQPFGIGSDPQQVALWRNMEEAARSVLNYGLPAFSGVVLSSLDFYEIEQSIHAAIVVFEPRIDPKTLEVKVKLDGYVLNEHNMLRIMIHGFMWNQPVPLELFLSADIDVETGLARVQDMRK